MRSSHPVWSHPLRLNNSLQLVQQAHKVNRDHQDRRAILGLRANKDLLDPQAPLDRKVNKGFKACKVNKDLLDPQAPLDRKVNKDFKARKVNKDLQESYPMLRLRLLGLQQSL